MATTTVSVQLSYLLRSDLTAPRKLVWMALRLDRHLKRVKLYSPTRIQRRIGVSRPTIRRALVGFREPWKPQWDPDLQKLARIQVRVKAQLITDKTLPPMARVVYCVLLGLRRLKRFDILSSYAGIASVLRLQPRTVRRAILQLVGAGWLAVSQKNQRAPLHFSFPDPKETQRRSAIRRIKQRLEKAKYHGEALTLLWCDTLVACDHYKDDHFPEHFTNPFTNERLQADRFYFLGNGVAVEFNGPQHDGPTAMYSEAQAKAQIARDQLKQQISARQKIPLVTIRPEDLTYRRMHELLGKALPLHSIPADDPVVEYLEYRSKRYRERMQQILQAAIPPSIAGSLT